MLCYSLRVTARRRRAGSTRYPVRGRQLGEPCAGRMGPGLGGWPPSLPTHHKKPQRSCPFNSFDFCSTCVQTLPFDLRPNGVRSSVELRSVAAPGVAGRHGGDTVHILPAGTAPPGFSWLLLAPPGSAFFLLALPGSSWLLLVPPGSSGLLQAQERTLAHTLLALTARHPHRPHHPHG